MSAEAPLRGEALAVRDGVRRAVDAALAADEATLVERLIVETALDPGTEAGIASLAARLAGAVRAGARGGFVAGLMAEYALSSAEGVALMCLAEALLRTPDAATRDALIRDRVAGADWRAHLGRDRSLFVNAATWGLLVSGQLHATVAEGVLSRALSAAIARGGRPLVRRAFDVAMRLMGEHFVLGETIEQALVRARAAGRRGFRHSYDMLGEGALTAADAERYLGSYRHAIARIGAEASAVNEPAAAGTDIFARPGISVKLSALHPRFERAKRARVLAELVPRVGELARAAGQLRIGLNIDAEEAARLELSLDVFEALAFDPALAGVEGLGFVVQAYGKRAPALIEALASIARRSGRRIGVRLVKGAYWDGEIKRAQEAGLDGFPVWTRRDHTDIAYLACARRMLAAPDAIFPQFATHNARTLATIHAVAGDAAYEFQCLHGMGEALYEEVVGPGKLGRPCRIYAPVGSHETLLAYLVRRLLENGANTSFVNRVADPHVSLAELAADPRARILARPERGATHPAIRLPRDLHGAARPAARGFDLGSEAVRAMFVAALQADAGGAAHGAAAGRPIRNPADPGDLLGHVVETTEAALDAALARAEASRHAWRSRGAAGRGAVLRRAADLLELRALAIVPRLVREAGKTVANAIAEIREAVDFLRYYAAESEALGDAAPLGTLACISPWNFPLAIFLGQVAAALAAGNAVIAKPAEETPLVAADAVALLHEAGVPGEVLVLVQGGGPLGAALVARPAIAGVLFTGSLEAARAIAHAIAARTEAAGRPIPLVAETGGLNAMVVDSSALAEQVVVDSLVSAFDSAGQRCSALRVLCLQEEIADRVLAMLKGAMAELETGDPRRLATDVGPVITPEAAAAIEEHVAAMAASGLAVTRAPAPAASDGGSFVAPVLIELDRLDRLEREVFGPVLHVLRFRREGLDALLAELAATGYGLTFGVQTRLDETVERCLAASRAGNVYVNRNIVGAVVGVQPFGGEGLSGTGPKAGGPLSLRRLVEAPPPLPERFCGPARPEGVALAAAAAAAGFSVSLPPSPTADTILLPGPVGERNAYRLEPRGAVLCRAATPEGAVLLVAAACASGNRAVAEPGFPIPPALARFVEIAPLPAPPSAHPTVAAALVEAGDAAAIGAFARALAERDGPIVPLFAVSRGAGAPVEFLVRERAIATNTAAAGGDPELMGIG